MNVIQEFALKLSLHNFLEFHSGLHSGSILGVALTGCGVSSVTTLLSISELGVVTELTPHPVFFTQALRSAAL